MIATTVMGVIMLAWSGVTLGVHGPVNDIPTWKPDLQQESRGRRRRQTSCRRLDPVTGEQQDPLGWLGQVPEDRRADSQPDELAEPGRR